jgi:hypothetical protein
MIKDSRSGNQDTLYNEATIKMLYFEVIRRVKCMRAGRAQRALLNILFMGLDLAAKFHWISPGNNTCKKIL